MSIVEASHSTNIKNSSNLLKANVPRTRTQPHIAETKYVYNLVMAMMLSEAELAGEETIAQHCIIDTTNCSLPNSQDVSEAPMQRRIPYFAASYLSQNDGSKI